MNILDIREEGENERGLERSDEDSEEKTGGKAGLQSRGKNGKLRERRS